MFQLRPKRQRFTDAALLAQGIFVRLPFFFVSQDCVPLFGAPEPKGSWRDGTLEGPARLVACYCAPKSLPLEGFSAARCRSKGPPVLAVQALFNEVCLGLGRVPQTCLYCKKSSWAGRKSPNLKPEEVRKWGKCMWGRTLCEWQKPMKACSSPVGSVAIQAHCVAGFPAGACGVGSSEKFEV